MKKRLLAVLMSFMLIASSGSVFAAEAAASGIETIQQPGESETAEDGIDATIKEETGETVEDKTDETVGDKTDETVKDETDETVEDKTDETVTDETGETVEDKTDETVEDKTDETVKDETDEKEEEDEVSGLEEEIKKKQEEMAGLIQEEGADFAEGIEEIEEEVTEGSDEAALRAVENNRICNIDSCLINTADRGKVQVQISMAEGVGLPNDLYLFALAVYDDSLEGYSPAAAIECQEGMRTYTFDADLLADTAENRLYSKFVVAIGDEGQYIPVSEFAYITNPEVLASDNVQALRSSGKTGHNSKKGIQVIHNIFSDVEDLGVSHAFFNIILEDIISLTPTSYSYNYGGNTFYFNESIINDYDRLLSTLADNGVTVTIALLNQYRSGYEFLIYPGVSPRAGTYGYAWNTVTAQGSAYIQATTNYLASRYNGSDSTKGMVSNWVIGNEVNDNLQYYYMNERDRDSFVTEYYKTFRIAYSAIKSGNGNANVYIPLEPRWMTADTTKDYGARGFLETFNNKAKAEGNFDWGVAYHAYSHPLSTNSILNDGTSIADQTGKVLEAGHVTDSWDSPIVTMKNINVLTDFMNDGSIRDTSGNVRSIILAEQGWTSISNVGATETTQAANIVLAYYKAEMNPDIDAFILRAHVDADEGSPYYKFGLWNSSSSNQATTKKYAYNIFKYMDTKESLTVTNFAKSTLGISDWASVVPGFNASKFDSMRTVEMAGIVNLNSWDQAANRNVISQNMKNGWVPQYNVHGISDYDYAPVHYPKGTAVTNPYANALCYQGVKYDFGSPMDLSSQPYLGFTMNLKPKDASGNNDKLLTRIRVFSGTHINDSNAILDVNKDYNLCVNLSDWEYRNSIDRIEVWIQENDRQKSFDGTFTIYDLQCAQAVGGSTILQGDADLNPEAVLFAFSDVPVIKGNWKYESVKYVYEHGIMNGISATTRFDPDEPLTRAMFATVLYRMAGSPEVEFTGKFSDVEDGKWYSKAIIWANREGIVSGYTDGSYGINVNITREQIAKMLYEYAKTSGYNVSDSNSLNSYTDKDSVSGWATGYMEWATAVKMISGKPNNDGSYRLDPKGEATRAECAAMLMRFENWYK